MKNKYHCNDLNLFCFISLAIFTAIVIAAPLAGEDYGLTKLFHDESLLARIHYAIDRSHTQIITWNARLGEQLTILELSLPNWISLTLYSVSFIALSAAIGHLFCNKRRYDWKKTACYSASLTFLLWPGMEVFFWKTASSGYLQPMILTLVAAIPYSTKNTLNVLQQNRYKYFGYLLICYLAGCSFENVPFALSISLLTLCVWQKRMGVFNYIPIFSLIAGWLTLISAHSTSVRRDFYSNAYPQNSNHLIHYLDRIKDVVSTFFNTSLAIFVLSIISLAYLKKIGLLTKYHLCLVMASVLVVGSMIASPYTEARSFLFAWCIMFSISCYALSIIVERYGLHKLTTPILFISVCFGLYTLSIYSSYSNKMSERNSSIINSLGTDTCKKGYKINLISTDYPYRYINNRDEWFFYNAKSVGLYYYNCSLLGGNP